jgi:muramoyltetrapeptide carboxypeptidase
MHKTPLIQILYPGSCNIDNSKLEQAIDFLQNKGFKINHEPEIIKSTGLQWPEISLPLEIRIHQFINALLCKKTDIILCAKGGYGTSSLLSQIPWRKLKKSKPKWLVGFSDISALHSAFYTKLNWQSLHAPMPGTKWWAKSSHADINNLAMLLNMSEKKGSLALEPLKNQKANSYKKINGKIFGGCLSVLCHLIGTPFFPKSFTNTIVFIEDTQETPQKILRYWVQLKQCKLLTQASAIILANFEGLKANESQEIKKQMAAMIDTPVYSCEQIGHCSPNFPIVIGAQGEISDTKLFWVNK